MEKLERYDLVIVAKSNDESTEEFVGALGVVTEVHEDFEYPYELIFVGKKLNVVSDKLGGLLWNDKQLEAI